MVVEHRHHSARAKTSRQGQTLRIDYSGLIDLPTIQLFDTLVLPSRLDCVSSIEHMELALTMFPPEAGIQRKCWLGWVPPSAVIVREDQQSASALFCENLATYGILRQTFLQHQQDLAAIWAQSAVLLAQSNSRRRS